MKYIFIGVGGTGAKALEALIFLCAAGLGPKDAGIRVVLVEQETENGNFRRTEARFHEYQRLRSDLRSGANQIDSDGSLFLTEIEPLLENKQLRWSPIPDDYHEPTLAALYPAQAQSREETLLFDSLFKRGGGPGDPTSEQHTVLRGGFYGRPPIGVAALAAAAPDPGTVPDDPLFQKFDEVVRASGQEEHRVFLAGSLFGGTGASCMPGLALLLRNMARDSRVHGERLHVGAAFMLPYFSFELPKGQELSADSDNFLQQTQQALKYYSKMLDPRAGEQRPFHQIYLLGQPRLTRMPSSQRSGKDQVNPPLLLDLYGALGALHFMRAPKEKLNKDQPLAYQRIVQRGDTIQPIEWDHVPAVTEGEGEDPRAALGAMARFAYAFSHVYADAVSQNSARGAVGKQPWFRTYVRGRDVKLQGNGAAQVNDLKVRLTAFCDRYLSWFATIAQPPSEEIKGAMPVNFASSGLLSGAALGTDACVALTRPANDQGRILSTAKRDFSHLIAGAVPVSLADILRALNGSPPEREKERNAKGLGVLLTQLMAACAVEAETQGRARVGRGG